MNRSAFAAAAAIVLIATGAAASQPLKGREFSRSARISLAKARSIALHARAGRVTDQELEKEQGGSGLRYSFDIRAQGRTFEVGVDAVTGKVLENGREGVHPD